jgi:dTDP-4-dehydrorhamnose reductase
VASWYDLARKTFQFAKIDQKIVAVTSEEFPRPAERPFYSVLDKKLLKQTFDIKLPHWEEGLRSCIESLSEQH